MYIHKCSQCIPCHEFHACMRACYDLYVENYFSRIDLIQSICFHSSTELFHHIDAYIYSSKVFLFVWKIPCTLRFSSCSLKLWAKSCKYADRSLSVEETFANYSIDYNWRPSRSNACALSIHVSCRSCSSYRYKRFKLLACTLTHNSHDLCCIIQRW